MHPISFLRSLTVNCFMRDPLDFTAVKPEIREFPTAQISEFADQTPVHPMIRDSASSLLNSGTQFLDKNVKSWTSYWSQICHLHILSDIFAKRAFSISNALC